MVPLRLDVCDDRSRPADVRSRPQLVLKDLTAEQPSCSSHARARRSPLHRVENVLLAAAAAAVLLYFFFTFALSLVHSIQQSYATPALPSVVMISKTVARGDTLTGLAKRYGDPNTYILAREEQIARVNHLSGTAPLVPGQRLRIPVTNPAVIAQIEYRYHRSLVAKR
jgi:nucleoid-associated protein YgaU